MENNKDTHTYHEGAKYLLPIVDMGVTVLGAQEHVWAVREQDPVNSKIRFHVNRC